MCHTEQDETPVLCFNAQAPHLVCGDIEFFGGFIVFVSRGEGIIYDEILPFDFADQAGYPLDLVVPEEMGEFGFYTVAAADHMASFLRFR